MGKGRELIHFGDARDKLWLDNVSSIIKWQVDVRVGVYETASREIVSKIERVTTGKWYWQSQTCSGWSDKLIELNQTGEVQSLEDAIDRVRYRKSFVFWFSSEGDRDAAKAVLAPYVYKPEIDPDYVILESEDR